MRGTLIALLGLMAAVPCAGAQVAFVPDTSRVRIVVFQFAAAPNDSSHRARAARFSRALVASLVGDPAIHVMTHPRAALDPSRPVGNAQFGIIGGLVDREGRTQVEVRTADLAAVRVLARDTGSIADSTAEAVAEAARDLARRLGARFVELRAAASAVSP